MATRMRWVLFVYAVGCPATSTHPPAEPAPLAPASGEPVELREALLSVTGME